MAKRKTTEEFINEAKLVHGDKYDYSRVEYKNNKVKVEIICQIHGSFWIRPENHLKGQGCRKCGIIFRTNKLRKSIDEFIEESNLLHCNKYDYSKVEYVDINTKVCIGCPEHGEFWQTPSHHLRGHGCPKCKFEKLSRDRTLYKEGLVFFNPTYGFYFLKNKLDNTHFIVRFLETGFEREYSKTCIFNNSVRDLYKPTVCGIGFLGEEGLVEGISETPPYKKWCDMINRCYNREYKCYIDCIVCDDWHNFSNFKRWFDENYIDGYELDKDLLSEGRKIYSPETCCFLPKEINVFLASLNSRNGYSLGVLFDKERNKFLASINENGKTKFIGRFNTENEAYNAYKNVKNLKIQNIADKYKVFISDYIYQEILNKKL